MIAFCRPVHGAFVQAKFRLRPCVDLDIRNTHSKSVLFPDAASYGSWSKLLDLTGINADVAENLDALLPCFAR
jgi:hypothetical protein